MQTFKKQSQLELSKSTQPADLRKARIEMLVSARLEARRKAFLLEDMEVQDE